MKRYAKFIFFSMLLFQMSAFAQDTTSPENNPMFSQQELDQVLAPIALYPDSLLSQILVAATYPLEVVQAAHWSSTNSALSGNDAVQAVDSQKWDISVKSLVAFPQVLQTMENKIDWTERLGDAFLSQQSQVMDTVQQLRQKAQVAGNLNSNSQINVSQTDGSLVVATANPEVIYVPYYDPTVVYGPWWWSYPPVYWAPWPGYAWDNGFAWGIGIGIGAAFIIGSWDWHNHLTYIHDPHHPEYGSPWSHDPRHRHAVPYRNATLNQQFGRNIPANASRADFRGREPSQTEPNRNQQTRAERNTSSGELRAHAFENVGNGAEVRSYSKRGHASLQGGANVPAPVSSPRGAPQSGHSKRH
jgi:hypothetical protein